MVEMLGVLAVMGVLSGSYRTAEDHGDFCNTWNVHCNVKSFDGECLGDARNLKLEGSTLCE